MAGLDTTIELEFSAALQSRPIVDPTPPPPRPPSQHPPGRLWDRKASLSPTFDVPVRPRRELRRSASVNLPLATATFSFGFVMGRADHGLPAAQSAEAPEPRGVARWPPPPPPDLASTSAPVEDEAAARSTRRRRLRDAKYNVIAGAEAASRAGDETELHALRKALLSNLRHVSQVTTDGEGRVDELVAREAPSHVSQRGRPDEGWPTGDELPYGAADADADTDTDADPPGLLRRKGFNGNTRVSVDTELEATRAGRGFPPPRRATTAADGHHGQHGHHHGLGAAIDGVGSGAVPGRLNEQLMPSQLTVSGRGAPAIGSRDFHSRNRGAPAAPAIALVDRYARSVCTKLQLLLKRRHLSVRALPQPPGGVTQANRLDPARSRIHFPTCDLCFPVRVGGGYTVLGFGDSCVKCCREIDVDLGPIMYGGEPGNARKRIEADFDIVDERGELQHWIQRKIGKYSKPIAPPSPEESAALLAKFGEYQTTERPPREAKKALAPRQWSDLVEVERAYAASLHVNVAADFVDGDVMSRMGYGRLVDEVCSGAPTATASFPRQHTVSVPEGFVGSYRDTLMQEATVEMSAKIMTEMNSLGTADEHAPADAVRAGAARAARRSSVLPTPPKSKRKSSMRPDEPPVTAEVQQQPPADEDKRPIGPVVDYYEFCRSLMFQFSF